MDLGFLMSKVGLGKIDDSADYCNAGHKEDDDGKGTGISGCRLNHDKCLTCDSAGRTCKGMNGAGGMHKLYGTNSNGGDCDKTLANCVRASEDCCWNTISCGWRGCRGSAGCKILKCAVKAAIPAVFGGGKVQEGHTCPN